MIATALLVTVLAQSYSTAGGGMFPPTPAGDSINIIQWDANALPRVYERSDQLPLTEEEIAKLSAAGFEAPALVKMIEERRCACDASADGLIRLKQKGAAPEVLAAVSTHALKPNRYLDLLITLDFTGSGNQARDAFLYVFLDDGKFTRVLSANVQELLSSRRQHESTVDRSDVLIARKVRRIQLPGRLPLRSYGEHRIMVATAASPTISHPSELTPRELAKAQTHTFDYPRVSLQSLCRVQVGYRRDAVLKHKWNYTGSRFECEWN